MRAGEVGWGLGRDAARTARSPLPAPTPSLGAPTNTQRTAAPARSTPCGGPAPSATPSSLPARACTHAEKAPAPPGRGCPRYTGGGGGGAASSPARVRPHRARAKKPF
eukprot:gene48521-biopygen94090